MESNAKCRYLKGTLRQVFYLSEAPPTCIQYNYSHREGGEGGGEPTIEKGIGPKVHNTGSQIPT